MQKKTREAEVKGYRKKHRFVVEHTQVGGLEFVRLIKNNTVVLNCTPAEFDKFRGLFK